MENDETHLDSGVIYYYVLENLDGVHRGIFFELLDLASFCD
jgi:hypothetical protein